jgi:hypothetical protein
MTLERHRANHDRPDQPASPAGHSHLRQKLNQQLSHRRKATFQPDTTASARNTRRPQSPLQDHQRGRQQRNRPTGLHESP